jgi:hypothetical protein
MTAKRVDLGKPRVDQQEEEEAVRIEQIRKNQPAIELLRSWMETKDEDDAAEQRETWEYLKKVLDEDRLSDRKLFP